MLGMVPALYADDEKENIVSTLREEALASGLYYYYYYYCT